MSAFFLLLPAAVLAGTNLPGIQSEYLIDVWQSDDGLPQNSVISLAQTSDGFIWVSTFEGLARFDGRKFEVYNSDQTAELSGDFFTTLRADARGNLWLRGERGWVMEESNGHFRRLGTAEGLPAEGAHTLTSAPDGTIWIGDSRGRLLKYDGRQFNVVSGMPPAPNWGALVGMTIDPAGNVWTASGSRLARFARGEWSIILDNKNRERVGPIKAMADGSLAVIAGPNLDRLFRCRDGQLSEFDTIPGGFYGFLLGEDASGELWISSHDGVLRRAPDGRWTQFTRAEGLGADTVRSELVDREGNRWFGTDGGGLIRLKRRSVRAVGGGEGMTKPIALSVAADGANGAWVAALKGGLNHFDGTRFSPVKLPDGLDAPELVWSVRPSRDGGLWIGLFSGDLCHQDADGKIPRFFSPRTDPGMVRGPIMALLESSSGDLWFGGKRGLTRYSGGQFRHWAATNGLADDQVAAIAEDHTGGIWVGTAAGLDRFVGETVSSFTETNGMAGNAVRSLFRDSEDTLWIGGHELTRLKGGRFSAIRATDGLPVNTLKGIIEDDLGYLWFSTPHGLLRADRRQLNVFCDSGKGSAEFELFSKADGLPSNECSGYQPAAWKGGDGRLWFATLNGLAIVDPKHLPVNEKPPPVVIETVIADGKPLDTPGGAEAITVQRDLSIQVPPGTVRLEFNFAALSFTAPEKNRFRCRLVGFESEWTRAATARMASYTRLPSGDYQFRVRACNNDGVWNDSGATLAVTVLPFIWQTDWFRFAVVAVLGAIVYWLFHRRIARVEARRVVQEAFSRQLIETQEAERQRIARELHDSLGQTLLLVKNRLALGIRKTDAASPIMEYLKQASTETSQALDEVRATARALCPVELDRLGLAKALDAMVERIRGTTALQISSEFDDLAGSFPKDVEVQLYRIAQEAVNNVLKHSQATEVFIELKREPGNVRLSVQDNGVGFDSIVFRRQGGFGLSGMTERARLIGGELSVKVVPGKGCRVTVTVPQRKSTHG